MKPPAVVLDTNVVFSALLFGTGRLAALRGDWQAGRFVPLASRATVEELARVLAYPKFALTTGDCQELLADYLPWCRAVTLPARPPRLPACPDPDDLPFLQLALAGKADCLVTGDKALLAMRARLPFAIEDPVAFGARLARRP